MRFSIRRFILGAPLATNRMEHETLNVPLGLAVFSADALSSTAYATDEVLLALAGSTYAIHTGVISLPVALAIAALIGLVVISYRQIIRAYPTGGGAYIVAKENLGTTPSHIAAAALLIDYILTVSVSISAGVAAITSTGLFPQEYATQICVFFALFIMFVNLRGLRESGRAFAIPAYTFLLSMGVLIGVGVWEMFTTHGGHSERLMHHALATMPTDPGFFTSLGFILIFLKAFSHGCAGLTGIEAVSNGVKAFKAPAPDRANVTMTLMGVLLAAIFLGITFLTFGFHILPKPDETIVSQVARHVFGGGTFFYYLVQFSTMIMLILAANTAFADFPRVSSLLANDGFLPRQLMNVGDRLVFNNGIMVLGFLSTILIILFHGDTHLLIPLYAVGVFVTFTMSQTGMVIHHRREREKGWRTGIAINGVGAVVTAIVSMILAIEKFTEGAWIILIAIPMIIFLFQRIKAHYVSVGKQLVLDESYTCPIPMTHKVLVLVSALGKATIPALQYAKTLTADVEAVHVELTQEASERLVQNWEKWGCGIPLKILPSPYRSLTEPIMDYLAEIDRTHNEAWVTIIVPEFVTKQFWHIILHNQTALLLKALLRFQRGKIVTTVRFYLED